MAAAADAFVEFGAGIVSLLLLRRQRRHFPYHGHRLAGPFELGHHAPGHGARLAVGFRQPRPALPALRTARPAWPLPARRVRHRLHPVRRVRHLRPPAGPCRAPAASPCAATPARRRHRPRARQFCCTAATSPPFAMAAASIATASASPARRVRLQHPRSITSASLPFNPLTMTSTRTGSAAIPSSTGWPPTRSAPPAAARRSSPPAAAGPSSSSVASHLQDGGRESGLPASAIQCSDSRMPAARTSGDLSLKCSLHDVPASSASSPSSVQIACSHGTASQATAAPAA